MSSNIYREQNRLDSVMEVIREEITKLEEDTAKRKDEVVHTRKHFWDEVKVNTDTFDDFLETIIGLRQEAQALSVSQSLHKHSSSRLDLLYRLKDAPYFGRIDFLEKGDSKAEQIYIGLSSLMDAKGEEFLIYDWRAPISSIYYDFQPGPAEYETPSGTIEGMLENKRQYIIRDGVLDSMFDTSIAIGDEILQQVLGKSADKQMQNIVATIQQEQNQIIRHDHGRLLIVHGSAGSGKTSVALQRIAYLLYKYRNQINPDQIILFSPNQMFSSYVANVLPELGEENMQQVTFQEYLYHRLGEEFDIENPFEQLEYVLNEDNEDTAYNTRLANIQFKASSSFVEVIHLYYQSLASSGMQFKDITFQGDVLISAQQMMDRFYSHDTSIRLHNRIDKLMEWLIKKIKDFVQVEINRPWVQEEIELLSDDEYHDAQMHLAKRKGLRGSDLDHYEVEHEELAQLIVLQKFKPIVKQIRQYQFIDFKALYNQLFISPEQINNWLKNEPPAEWTDICHLSLNMIHDDKLYYEDATPFLFLKELIVGFQKNNSIKHIVVDEAQDYSPFQFEYLRRLFPSARMTVLGDFNQAVFAHARETNDFNILFKFYGPDKTKMIHLDRSYRSTKPIIEFTRKLIPHGDRIIPFERSGERPVLKRVSNHNELHVLIVSKVHELRDRGYRNIAIICKSAKESMDAFQSLKHMDEEMKLIKSSSLEYEQGLVVIPSYLSKGIEFDAVIVYDASKEVYNDLNLQRVFYTVCTRAMHELHLYSVGEPSPLLKNTLQEGLLQT